MASNTYSPRTRQQDERPIIRYQTDFSAGMMRDVPASTIPENGLSDLKNMKNMGTYLPSRKGSRVWGDYATYTRCAELPRLFTGIAIAYSVVEGNERYNTVTGGYAFTSADVDRYLIHDDGTHERIVRVESESLIITITESDDNKASSNAGIREQINGLFYHEVKRNVVLMIGNSLYVADNKITLWKPTYHNCAVDLDPSNTEMKELDNNVIIYNKNGIYKLNLDDTYPTYYKMNSPIPLIKPKEKKYSTPGTEYVYRRKYTYSYSRMRNNVDAPLFTERNDSGSFFDIESGSCRFERNTSDFAVVGADTELGVDSEATLNTPLLIENLTVLDYETGFREQHWNHYSVYCTLDIGENGVSPVKGKGNNTELFIWSADVPVCKSYIVNVSGSTVTATNGLFNGQDVGTNLWIYSGSGDINDEASYHKPVIQSVTNPTTVVIDSSLTISNQPAAIGGTTAEYPVRACHLSISDGLATANEAIFTEEDVGKTLFISDGSTRTIKAYANTNNVELVEDSNSLNLTGAAGLDPSQRHFTDTVTDTQLEANIAGWTLIQRFWENMPDCDAGEITKGILFGTVRDGNYVYYSQLADGYEYLGGYYHPTYQYTFFKNGIRAIKQLPDIVAVYCKNSTYTMPLNVFDEVRLDELGVIIFVLTGQNEIDGSIGLLDYGSLSFFDSGKHIMITSEPAIRLFDGYNYSENLASGKLMDDLISLQTSTSAIYNPLIGYTFWGTNE